jgi:VanZ family protein
MIGVVDNSFQLPKSAVKAAISSQLEFGTHPWHARASSTRGGQLWRAWIATLIWLSFIVIESTDSFSSAHTSRFLWPIFHFLAGIDMVRFESWHHYIRKAGHCVGYFVLSLLLFRAWRATFPCAGVSRWIRRWSLQWTSAAFFVTALVASLDEWHQSYIPSRTGTYKDVLLDSCAALMAQIAILGFFFLTRKPRFRVETAN